MKKNETIEVKIDDHLIRLANDSEKPDFTPIEPPAAPFFKHLKKVSSDPTDALLEMRDFDLDALRETLEESFTAFARYFFRVLKRADFLFNYHHTEIITHLERVVQGEIQFLQINIPPRYSKTLLVIQLFSAWCYAKNPSCEFIHLSYSDPLAKSNSESIKLVIKSPEFQELWNVPILKNKDSKSSWGTEQAGSFLATAAGGSVTGFGAGKIDEIDENNNFIFGGAILIDDPLKAGDAKSDARRGTVNERWDETIKTRRNGRYTPVIVIMQRLHEDDFCGHLLNDTEFHWHRLVIPAIINEGTEQERAMWEDKHDLAELRAMREKNPYAFAGQYQQDPSPKSGGLIKETYWTFYNDMHWAWSQCEFFYWTADTALTENEANDPSLFKLWGANRERLFSFDALRGWLEFPELIRKSRLLIKKYPENAAVYVEAKANGLSAVQQLRKTGIYSLPWNPNDFHYPADKVGRVNYALLAIENGSVTLPVLGIFNPFTEKTVNYTKEMVDECKRFSVNDSHLHDEYVDCLTMAVSIWKRLLRG